MERFIASLEQARKVVGEELSGILRALSSVDADRSAALRIREIEGWLDQEIPRLRRRNQLIQEPDLLKEWAADLVGLGPLGLTPGPGGGGLTAFDEKALATRTLATDEGEKLAENLSALGHPTPYSSENVYDGIFDRLAGRRNDADFTAGFFSALGPKGAAAALRKLNHYHGESARKHWKTMGEALATAVARRPRTLGPAWEPENLGKTQGADLGLVLGHGRFPSGWFTEVIRPRVQKAAEGGGPARWTPDLSHFLSALANNPETARALFNDLSPGDLRKLFSELNEQVSLYPNEHDAIAFDLEKEFGRMLAAGAGVFEKRPPGPEAVRFAFNTMTTMGDLRTKADFRNPEGQPMEVAKGARIFMSMLAGAYAAEIIEGADASDANRTQDSAFEKTATLTAGLAETTAPSERRPPGSTTLSAEPRTTRKQTQALWGSSQSDLKALSLAGELEVLFTRRINSDFDTRFTLDGLIARRFPVDRNNLVSALPQAAGQHVEDDDRFVDAGSVHSGNPIRSFCLPLSAGDVLATLVRHRDIFCVGRLHQPVDVGLQHRFGLSRRRPRRLRRARSQRQYPQGDDHSRPDTGGSKAHHGALRSRRPTSPDPMMSDNQAISGKSA
ncbi:hypothetical protein [Streptosporangium sp. H16]|uniref:hypothetical protein n=1 Tax=Streptosporangium sp. H16 TaxID=3444184 RepID=UPI003F79A00D